MDLWNQFPESVRHHDAVTAFILEPAALVSPDKKIFLLNLTMWYKDISRFFGFAKIKIMVSDATLGFVARSVSDYVTCPTSAPHCHLRAK
jgi:hypothetical protein